MLNNFKEIYNEVMNTRLEDGLLFDIINRSDVRAFAYEVCKKCLQEKSSGECYFVTQKEKDMELFVLEDMGWL